MFVDKFKNHYKRNLVSNVHGLLHIVDFVRVYGPMDGYSAYKYESAIGKLQLYLKNNTRIFSQIRRRLGERETAKLTSEWKIHKLRVSTDPRDNCFLLNESGGIYVRVTEINGDICKVRK